MTIPLIVQIYENGTLVHADEFSGPVELGRQDTAEPRPFSRLDRDGRCRLIVAAWDETTVGRKHALVEPLEGDRVRVTNGGNRQSVWLRDGWQLAPGRSCELVLPVTLILGAREVNLQAPEAQGPLHSLLDAPLPPRSQPLSSVRFPGLAIAPAGGVENRAVLTWLSTAMEVLQAAAGSEDFLERAAQAAVDMVDLDSAVVLLWRDGVWQPRVVRQARRPEMHGAPPSKRVLAQVLEQKRTFWQIQDAGSTPADSLANVDAVVAAPILDSQGQVHGALYGERRRRGARVGGTITEVEAMLVELLARGVASGLARIELERAAVQARVQFEQFFTTELAGQLANHPDWLAGQEKDVSVLFVDVRGFSRISERLGPAQTVEWIQDVLGVLSDHVLDRGGVLVDYVGDALLALWGAPGEQPDHAVRACQAALDMLASVPDLNERWQQVLGEPFDLGIGINTGLAQVGNTGSRRKFKYGALGNTVNLASRVQGVTRQVRSRLVITGATRALLPEEFRTRRLCEVRVVGIQQPVELHELFPFDHPDWPAVRDEYERALLLFEAREFPVVARTLAEWMVHHRDDGPALLLVYRAVRCQVEGPLPGHPVWELTEK